MTTRVLRDLPNQEGFRFIGVTLDQERVPCIVKKNPIGCHGAYRESDGEPIYFQLYGWEPHSEQNRERTE